MSSPYPEQPKLPFGSPNPSDDLLTLLEELGKKPNRQDIIWLGQQLGKLTNRRPFSYKYLHSVIRGTVEAGWPLRHAVTMALLRQDGVSPLKAEAQEYTVLSTNEIEGMFVMGEIKTCASAECLVQFVTDHPARKYCPFCRPPERRK